MAGKTGAISKGLPASSNRRDERRFAPEEPAGTPRGDRAGDFGKIGFRAMAAGLLRRVRRTARETRHYKSNGRIGDLSAAPLLLIDCARERGGSSGGFAGTQGHALQTRRRLF